MLNCFSMIVRLTTKKNGLDHPSDPAVPNKGLGDCTAQWQNAKGLTCFVAPVGHGLLVVVIICGDVTTDVARVAAEVATACGEVSVTVAAAFCVPFAGVVSVATVVCEAVLV